jgi:hypothetical protein
MDRQTLPLACLFDALAAGERIARDCAAHQGAICVDPQLRRCFRTQSRQEAVHALVFDTTAALLARDTPPRGRLQDSLAQYRSRLQRDLHAGRLAESLIGLQVVLEGVGAAVLGELDLALARHGDSHPRLRRTLLAQEQAHRDFGVRALARLVRNGRFGAANWRSAADDYRERAVNMLSAAQDLFDAFEVGINGYERMLNAGVERALSGAAA